MKTLALLVVAVLLFFAGMYVQQQYPHLFTFLATPTQSAATTTPAVPTPTPKPTPQPSPTAPLSARVVITAPTAGATVGKTFTITGKAPGSWYFEASFPIIVSDADGNKIATSHGQAQGDWMTTNVVPFTASVDVGSYTGKATVNLLRDNPSGLPENDDSTSFEVVIQ